MWKPSNLARAGLSLLAIAVLVWAVTLPSVTKDALLLPFAVAFSSLFFIYLRASFSRLSLIPILAGSALLWLLQARVAHAELSATRFATVLGLTSLGAMVIHGIWAPDSKRRFYWELIIPSALFLTSDWGAAFFLGLIEKARPNTLDLYLYSFDASLRVQFAFMTGQLFAAHPRFGDVCVWVYIALPVFLAVTFASVLVKRRDLALAAFLSFLVTGPVGLCFYYLFPGLGPAHVFGDLFPWQPFTMEQFARLQLEPIPAPGLRNAIPSLHAAWIFLVFWYARSLSRVEKGIAAVLVVLTLFATLGLGEHYFVDLVVALPFTVLILALTNALVKRNAMAYAVPFFAGLVTTLAWFGALRFYPRVFWASPILPWAAVLSTIAVAIWGGFRLPSFQNFVAGSHDPQVQGQPAAPSQVTLPSA